MQSEISRRLALLGGGLTAASLVSACVTSNDSIAHASVSDDSRRMDAFVAAYAGMDVARTMAWLADDLYFEDVTAHYIARSREEMRQFIEPVPQLYQELRVVPINRINATPWIISQQRIAGTMRKPDGSTRPVDVQGLSMFMWRDGKIARWYDYYDVVGFRQQTR